MMSILEHLRDTRAILLEMAEAIPADSWRQTPRPGAWSAGEVIAHLIMVEKQVVEGAAKVSSRPPVPVPFWKRTHLPVQLTAWRGIRVRTPIPLDPNLVDEKQPMLERLAAGRRVTLEFLEKNRSRDLHAYRFPHPFLGSLNLYDWMRMLAYHETRHAQQLQEIVKTLQR